MWYYPHQISMDLVRVDLIYKYILSCEQFLYHHGQQKLERIEDNYQCYLIWTQLNLTFKTKCLCFVNILTKKT